jgi:hypothetical protein
MTSRTTAAPATRSKGALVSFLAGSIVLVILVLTQAAMAGQALFEGFDILIHGYVGNASFTLGVVLLGVALFGRLPKPLMILAALNMVALFGQTGLGYVGREQSLAASIHVPLGVTIFGITMVQTTLAIIEYQRRA